MSKLKAIKTHLPCPCGASSDAYSINADGSGKCYSGGCNKFFPAKAERSYMADDKLTYEYYSHRGISRRTFEFYDVKTSFSNGAPNEIGFKYPKGAVKIRNMNVKDFYSKGAMSEESLFGMDRFDPGSKDSITITEGEYDALAVFEMLGGKTAAVSVRSSGAARSNLEAAREYVNSFKKIYICFDNDEAGQKAARECSTMFDFNKVYHIKLSKHKDANEYLEKQDVDAFIKTWQNARRYSPNSIISTFSDILEALNTKQAEQLAMYPFPDLQENLKGMHRGEFIILKGKQGIGKTEICRAIVHANLKSNATRMATIFLEEDQKTTIRGVATYETLQPVSLDDSGFTNDDVLKAYRAAVGDDDTRLYIHTHFSSDDEGEIIDNIRFLVTVAGVSVVFLDNLTMLNTGREGEDERLRIDRITRMLRNLVNELGFCLVLIAHTNDDGTTRGSRLPDIVANTVVSMKRDIPDNKLWFDVEKARLQGSQAGPSGFGLYDRKTYVLRAPTEQEKVAALNQ